MDGHMDEYREFLRWKEQCKRSQPGSSQNVVEDEEKEDSTSTEHSVNEDTDEEEDDKGDKEKQDSAQESDGSADKESVAGPSECTADQYLSKRERGKGKKSSEPAKNFHHILKCAAIQAKVWDTGLSISQISPAQRKHIHDKVIEECPTLRGHTRRIDAVLSRSLANHRYYLKKKKMKTQGKSKHKKSTKDKEISRAKKPKKSSKLQNSTQEPLKTNDKVVIFANDQPVALATFKSQTSEMYCKLKFDELISDCSIELPEATSDNKTNLKDLEKNDYFLWRVERVKKEREKRLKFKNSKYSDYVH